MRTRRTMETSYFLTICVLLAGGANALPSTPTGKGCEPGSPYVCCLNTAVPIAQPICMFKAQCRPPFKLVDHPNCRDDVTGTTKDKVWFRWPFSPSPFVTINPRDGFPDFSPVAGSFNQSSIACPPELTRNCCGSPHGDEKCGEKTCTTRPCALGLYCANFANTAKYNSSRWLPHMRRGKSRNGNTRKAIARTRKNILQRAVGWLAAHSPYLSCHTPGSKYGVAETCAQDDPMECPAYGHTASCEGFVTMAHGAPGYDDEGDRTIIPCTQLQPGDGCFHHDKYPGGVNHVWMFREWANPGHPGPQRLWQMGGGGGAVNMKTQTKEVKDCGVSKKGPCIVCFKYKHIVKDGGEGKFIR